MPKFPELVVTLEREGPGGNVFLQLARVHRTLTYAGYQAEARELARRVWECRSYEDAHALMGEYVTIAWR